MSGCRPVTIITKCCLACSRPIFLTDKADDELEMTTVCHRPEGLEQLEAQTNFTKQELQILYRGFKNVIQILIAKDIHQSSSMQKVLFCTLDLLKSFCFPQECPSGVVNEETFKHIYAQFFPHGGKEQHFPSAWRCSEGCVAYFMCAACVADASMYAHYLFNAFDTANNGSIKFKVNTLDFSKAPYLRMPLQSAAGKMRHELLIAWWTLHWFNLWSREEEKNNKKVLI